MRLFSRGGVNLCTAPVTFNPNDGDCVRPLDQYYPDPNNPDPFGSVDIKRDIGSSTYHALGLSLERRFSQGLPFSPATPGHTPSMMVRSEAANRTARRTSTACQCDKGPSVFDVRHDVAVNAVYELPFGPGKAFLNTAVP